MNDQYIVACGSFPHKRQMKTTKQQKRRDENGKYTLPRIEMKGEDEEPKRYRQAK